MFDDVHQTLRNGADWALLRIEGGELFADRKADQWAVVMTRPPQRGG